MSVEEELKKAGFKLAELKEAFIIEEITPFIENESLKQSLRVRIKSNQDAVNEYKQRVKDVIEKEAKNWHNQDWDKIIKKELGLE